MMLVFEFDTSTRTEMYGVRNTSIIPASHGAQEHHGREKKKKKSSLKGSSALLLRTVALYGMYQIQQGWRTSDLLKCAGSPSSIAQCTANLATI